MAATGYKVGKDVCNILGLDPRMVHRLIIDISVLDVVKVHVQLLPDAEKVIAAARAIQAAGGAEVEKSTEDLSIAFNKWWEVSE